MRTFVLPGLMAIVLACSPGDPGFSMGDVEFAAPAGSGEPNLYATPDGYAMLTWFEMTGNDTHALRVAVRDRQGWSDPKTIVEGRPFFVNWADFPSLVALEDGTWIVHWLEKVAPATFAYHVKIVLSTDQGTTWSAPLVPHRDDSPTEHGFVSIVPWRDGQAALVWLDGRQMGGKTGAGKGKRDVSGAMTVRFTTVDSRGALGEEVLLDERTCECCQTSLARTSSGLVAAYRDRSDAEIRDIAVARYIDGKWTPPELVGSDNWHYPGCPVNGPQLSAAGDSVAIAWFTAPEQEPKVYVAFSTDAGASFGDPVRVDDGRPRGRVDIELLADGSAIVVWLELTEPDAEIRARRISPDGTVGSSWLVSSTSEARGSGFPRMVRVGDELLFAWTLTGAEGGVRVAAAR